LEGKLHLTRAGHVNLDWLAWFMAIAVWTQALYIVMTTTYWTLQSLHPIPYWDSWATADFLAREQPVTLSWLWSQHNEHRILIPRLISLADYRFFRGCGFFDLALIWLMQVGSAGIIAFLSLDVIGRSRDRRPWRTLSGGLIVCLAFSAPQMENFFWSFQTGFVGAMFFSLLAFFCLKQSVVNGHSAFWIAGGALAAIASALGLAGGLITLFVFAAGSWIARTPRRTVLLIVAVFVAFTAAYLYGYSKPTSSSSPMDSLLYHRLEIFEYGVVFMGNAWSQNFQEPIAAAIVGTWGLELFLLTFLFPQYNQARSKGQDVLGDANLGGSRLTDRIPPASLALFCVAVLVIGQCFITALGRLGFGLGQATASRYATPSVFFWIVVLVLILALVLENSSVSSRFIAAYCALLLAMIGTITVRNKAIGELFARRSVDLELAADALRVGVTDSNSFRILFPQPDIVVRDRPFLMKHGLSIFSDNRYTLLGRHIRDIANPSLPGSCLGSFDVASGVAVQGGAEVQGWAWSRQEKKAPNLILLADDSGIVVGLASGGIERLDVAAAIPEINDRKTGWRGYAKEARQVSAYAITDNGREVCRLPGVFNIVPGTL